MFLPPPTARRVDKVEGISLTVVDMGDLQLVPIAALEAELRLKPGRLRGIVTHSERATLFGTCSLWPREHGRAELAINRLSLPVLASRLRTGTNNQLLKFAAVAQEVAIPVPESVLMRKVRAVRIMQERKAVVSSIQATMTNAFIQAYDEGVARGFEAAAELFHRLSGKHESVLSRFFNGSYSSVSAREAQRAIKKRDGRFAPVRSPRGRPPLLSQQQRLELVRQVNSGANPHELARLAGVSIYTLQRTVESHRRAEEMLRAAHTELPPTVVQRCICERADAGEGESSIAAFYGVTIYAVRLVLLNRELGRNLPAPAPGRSAGGRSGAKQKSAAQERPATGLK